MISVRRRHYLSVLGRWSSLDPFHGKVSDLVTLQQSINRYEYCLASPISQTDPSGLRIERCIPPCDVIDNTCRAVGARPVVDPSQCVPPEQPLQVPLFRKDGMDIVWFCVNCGGACKFIFPECNRKLELECLAGLRDETRPGDVLPTFVPTCKCVKSEKVQPAPVPRRPPNRPLPPKVAPC